MSISTFQKITIVSCVVLCVALLLPKMLLSRGKRDAEGAAGQFPPVPHRAPVSEEQRRSGRTFSRAHNPEAIARAKGAGAGAGTGGKSNLAGQIIPIYGFGILLYILYILFKITSRGKTSKPPESRFTAVRPEHTQRKITDFELAQLQDRLNETKDVIERIISSASIGTDRAGAAVAVDEEQKLLQQLQEITRVMQEGRLVDAIPAHTADACGHQWDDLPDDSRNEHFCCVHSPDMTTQSDDPEEPVPEETTDDNTKTPDIPACDSINQSQTSVTGSDITPGPVSEHSTIRRRNIISERQ